MTYAAYQLNDLRCLPIRKVAGRQVALLNCGRTETFRYTGYAVVWSGGSHLLGMSEVSSPRRSFLCATSP